MFLTDTPFLKRTSIHDFSTMGASEKKISITDKIWLYEIQATNSSNTEAVIVNAILQKSKIGIIELLRMKKDMER